MEKTAISESPDHFHAANMTASATIGDRMIQKLSASRPAMNAEGGAASARVREGEDRRRGSARARDDIEADSSVIVSSAPIYSAATRARPVRSRA